MSNDFLFELGCEELPSKSVWPLADNICQAMRSALQKATIDFGTIQAFASPRRIALRIEGIAEEQPAQTILKRGPAVNAAYDAAGNPTPALTGFARSCGVAIDQLSQQKTDKGEWFVYELQQPGVKTKDLLPQFIQQSIASLPLAKPMRWGAGDVEFARPVHWVVMLWNEHTLPCHILGVESGCTSYGHRFHHPQAIKIHHPREYETVLRAAKVIVDFAERRQNISDQIHRLATQQQAEAIVPEDLLDEVCSIVEWPNALLAGFANEFLQVPPEALIAAMQEHQKCFALRNQSGKLLPHFIAISNIESREPTQVVRGNEKVMCARLSDADFFYTQDKKQPLSQHIAGTAKVLFQAKLGTLHEKTKRMQELMTYLIKPLQLNEQQAIRACELSKCDLLTGMVGEFPELQGLMGYYYALHDGESNAVAVALNEQYLPRFSADSLPETALGSALSLVDRLDTLVGIFLIGEKPSGVKDPFKLRRHALAILRLLIATPAAISLKELLQHSAGIYASTLLSPKVSLDEIQEFILDRLQAFYQTQQISADIVLAVRKRQSEWFYDFDKRVKALAAFVLRPEAAVLSAACKRVNNLLQQHSANQQDVDSRLFTEEAERALFDTMVKLSPALQQAQTEGDYSFILNNLASLREVVDAFFNQVMVMVDDVAIKNNRLALLSRLQQMLQNTADISLLQ